MSLPNLNLSSSKKNSHKKKVDSATSEFVSLASHQLRAPISTIKLCLEMVLDGDAGSISNKQRELLEEANENVNRMNSIVNSLLNLTRINLGTFVMNPVEIDLHEQINSILAEIKTRIKKKKLKVTVSGEKLPLMNLDKDVVSIMIQNLLTNAVKYSPEKSEIKIKLSTVRKGKSLTQKIKTKESSVLIEISDHGLGIPINQQGQVFSRLFRADNAIKASENGTGLGLYITKKLVEKAKGVIWFESEEGNGSSFYVLLPLSAANH